ncbi:MAG: DUF3006 domain-containing protein, partial [Myxococcota bacterium]|nr:DUF3006 domain-containing protein [Myxococcota bacterium]
HHGHPGSRPGEALMVQTDESRSVWLDRVEGDRAILGTEGGDEMEVPAALLPPGAVEGSWMKLSLSLDPDRTSTESSAVSDLLRRLGEEDDGGDLVL